MKKYIKIGIYVFTLGVVLAGGIGIYLFNMPHRDIQSTKTDLEITAANLVAEYLENPTEANAKYLDAEGESKILEVSGEVASVTEDFNKNLVVVLKSPDQKAGVSCTFLTTVGSIKDQLHQGKIIKVKGVIRSGASYDPDLGFYENVIMDKCDLVSKI